MSRLLKHLMTISLASLLIVTSASCATVSSSKSSLKSISVSPTDVHIYANYGKQLNVFAVYADRIFSPLPARALVLFIANDITGGEKDKSPEEVKKLFLYVVKIFRKSHPGVPVFWIAITPTESRWKAWPRISEANDLIRETCENRSNLYFIRTDYAFLNEKGEPRAELFRPDKLHLNTEGYKVWTEIIKKELSRVLNK